MRRKSSRRFLQWCVLALLPVANCLGGLGWTTGKEWHLWTDDQYSVIVARVIRLSPTKDVVAENGTDRATLEPLVLLAGSIDASKSPTLEVTFNSGGNNTSILSPPAQGATVIVVLQGTNFIVSDICTFMPGKSSLVTVDGLGDPRILETLKRLQEARAHPDPDPHRTPTTRPAK